MLSLSPRYDLYRFMLPDGFLPDEVAEKYRKILNQEPGVIVEPLDYLNESIVTIKLPGISDINIVQNQSSSNPIIPTNSRKPDGSLGRINREPAHPNTYIGSNNPLEKIEQTFSVTFRKNQGLLNYFMLYETIFYRFCKHLDYEAGDEFRIYLLNEDGVATSYIELSQCHIDGIEGIEFDFTKQERQVDSFSVDWKFNNINFEFLDIKKDLI